VAQLDATVHPPEQLLQMVPSSEHSLRRKIPASDVVEKIQQKHRKPRKTPGNLIT
jgi:hypothetical protein